MAGSARGRYYSEARESFTMYVFEVYVRSQKTNDVIFQVHQVRARSLLDAQLLRDRALREKGMEMIEEISSLATSDKSWLLSKNKKVKPGVVCVRQYASQEVFMEDASPVVVW